jgi:hypothetical protein
MVVFVVCVQVMESRRRHAAAGGDARHRCEANRLRNRTPATVERQRRVVAGETGCQCTRRGRGRLHTPDRADAADRADRADRADGKNVTPFSFFLAQVFGAIRRFPPAIAPAYAVIRRPIRAAVRSKAAVPHSSRQT